MSLIDQLREAGAALPPSHVPGPAEGLLILGALIAHTELGDEFLDAAAGDLAALDANAARREGEPTAPVDRVDNLLAPKDEGEDGGVVGETTVTSTTASVPVPVQAPAESAELVQLREQRDAQQRTIDELRQQVQTLVADRDRTQASAEPGEPKPNEGGVA